MKPLFNFKLRTLSYQKEVTQKDNLRPLSLPNLSRKISKNLSYASDILSDNGIFFEAMSAEDLGEKFVEFAGRIEADASEESREAFLEEFSMLWEELMEWGQQEVNLGKPQYLAEIPPLPSLCA